MPVIDSQFRPAWWLRQAHLQTLWPSLSRRSIDLPTRRERVELPDGDFIDLDLSGPPDAPAVLILHGLEGSIDSPYARGIMLQLNRIGLRACLMHFRGCSEEPNRLPIAYHSGKTDDPAQIAEHIRKHQAPLYGAIGVSLGGNVLLKWLGEAGENAPFERAAVMSVPFVLNDAALRLRTGLSRIYEHHLIGRLQANFRQKFSAIPCPLDVDVRQLRTFRQFDDKVTAPLHGFADVDDYYRRCSSRQFIPSIRTPTLILHARDDPFMFPGTVPGALELPDQVTLELSEHGGHAGFIGGRWPGQADYWGERRLAQWFARKN
jgi:predicted alpha/beta-fold hydrolase